MTLDGFGGQLQEPIVEDRSLNSVLSDEFRLFCALVGPLGDAIVKDRPLELLPF